MTQHITHQYLRDTEQSAFHLSTVQLTGITSLPAITSSVLLIQHNNFSSALVMIVLGNLISWLIRLGLIAMTFRERKSTLDISREYIGYFGGYLVAIVILSSTLSWYIAETTIASNALYHLLPIDKGSEINRFIQISVALGMASTLLCLEGMKMLRWVAVISLPFIAISFLFVLLGLPHQLPMDGETKITFSGIALVLGINLGMSTDLPTFFRHRKTWKDAFNGLMIIQIVSLFISVGGLFFASILNEESIINQNAVLTPFFRTSLIVLIFFSVICANVANVYASSVGWEIIAPILAGRKEYLILGLGFTIIFVLVADLFSVHFLLSLTEAAMINLCYVLIIGYILYLIQKRYPVFFQQVLYFSSWVISIIITNYYIFKSKYEHLYPIIGFILIFGMVTVGLLSNLLWKHSRRLINWIRK